MAFIDTSARIKSDVRDQLIPEIAARTSEAIAPVEAAVTTAVARMTAAIVSDRPRYIRRAQLLSADTDAAGRVTDATLTTGATYSRSLAVQVGNGLNYGPRGLSLGTVEGVLPLGAASYDTRRPVYVKRRQLLSGDVSPSGRVIEARYADGGALTITGTVELPRRPLYARRQYASAVEIDRRGRIVAATLANGRAFPAFAGSDQIVVLGDSLAAGFTAAIGLATNRPVIGMGIGSQQPPQIVNRVIGVTMRAADRRIVAGANVVTHLNGIAIAGASKAAPQMFLSRIGSTGVRYTSVGRWGGVRGTVTVVPSTTGGYDAYSFVPDADQMLPVAVPDDTPFVPDHPKSATHVVSLGRNGSWTDGVAKAQMDRLTRFLGHDRILWLAVPNGDIAGERAGEAQYAEIAALNATFFADRAGYEYLDVPRFLKGQGLALAGLTPNAQDETDAARDVVPTQLRGDTLHYNATGSRIAAQHLIAPHIAQRKW